MGLHNSGQHPMDPQRCSKISRDPPLGRRRCICYTMANWPHRCTTHLESVPRFIPSSEPLQMVYMHLWLIWRPMRSLVCPHTHWEHHRFTVRKIRGHPLVHHFLRILFIIMALMGLIRPLGGPHNMQSLLFDLLRGLLFHLWASLVGLSPKVS